MKICGKNLCAKSVTTDFFTAEEQITQMNITIAIGFMKNICEHQRKLACWQTGLWQKISGSQNQLPEKHLRTTEQSNLPVGKQVCGSLASPIT